MSKRKYYLFDSSAALHFYIPHRNPKVNETLAFLLAQKLGGNAFFYIPIFCIAEIFNTLAKHHYRTNELTKSDYDDAVKKLKEHIRNRQFFYPYSMDRYHNLNTDAIFPIEHTINTEFTVTGLPTTASTGEINLALAAQNEHSHIGHYHLSTLDITIIAMGIELRRVHDKNFALISKDKRLIQICNAIPQSERPPKAFYLQEITKRDISAFHQN